jgi:hypothetical protein
VEYEAFTPDCLYPSTSEQMLFVAGPDYLIPPKSYIILGNIPIYKNMIMESAPFLEFLTPDILDIATTEKLEKCVQVFIANPTIPGEFRRISKSDKPFPHIGGISKKKL